MNGTVIRLEQLEARFERLRLDLQDTQRKLTQALQQIRELGSHAYGGGNGSGPYVLYLNPIVIAPGGSVTGQTLYWNIGGTQTSTGITSATVYNEMASATVATSGKVITVGPNPDGSYSVVTQSC